MRKPKSDCSRPLADRLNENVDRSGGPDACHLWTARKNPLGYGLVRPAKYAADILAHRAAWIVANGPIPKGAGYHGTCVCHRCDTPACVNVAHLFLGTMGANMADKTAKGRGRGPRGERNSSARLAGRTDEIRARFAAGETMRSIARGLGVQHTSIMMVVRGRTYGYV